MATKSRRRVARSRGGKKQYVIRQPKGAPGGHGGEFKDVQSYKKAHGQDVKRRSRSELVSKNRKITKRAL